MLLSRVALGEDPVDAQIQRLREGKDVTMSDAEFQKIRLASFNRYYDIAAQSYLDQVKWSIVFPEKQGGWPAKSVLIIDSDIREPIYQRLKQKSVETNDPIFDYALICPALYMMNEPEVLKLLVRLQAKDAFLYDRADTEIKWWRNVISKQLGAKR